MSFSVTPFGIVKASRCWEGYEPVPGKKPYSKGSCRPKGTKKKTTEKTSSTTKQAGLFYRDLDAPSPFVVEDHSSLTDDDVSTEGLATIQTQTPRLLTRLFSSPEKDVQKALQHVKKQNPNALTPSKNPAEHLSNLLGKSLQQAYPSRYRNPTQSELIQTLLKRLPDEEPANAREYAAMQRRFAPMASQHYSTPEEQAEMRNILEILTGAPHMTSSTKRNKQAAVRELQLLLTKRAVGPAAPQQMSAVDVIRARTAKQKADLERQAATLKANKMTSGTFAQGQLQLPGGATPKPALPPASQDYTNHELLNKIVQQRRQIPRQPNPANQIENKSVTSRSLTDIMRQRQAPKAPAAPKMPASGIPNKSYTSPSAADFLKKRGSEGGAWTRAEGKSESGGLNAKGRASLKAQGQNIKPPVTESNPTGERKDRKSSFCARMGGMKKKLTSSETANDPDSRINKALRKWKC